MDNLLDQFRQGSNSSSTEEVAAIQKLVLAVYRGKKILAKPKVPAGNVRMWVGHARIAISKVFGKDSELLNHFPMLIEVPTPENSRPLLESKIAKIEALIEAIDGAALNSLRKESTGKIFIGHGRSPQWRELKDFLSERLNLQWDEFNREAVAGLTTFERISAILEETNFAFLIMTAEDEHNDSTIHARQNVVHEVGLFQGRLGPKKAIILLEDGCKEFSNIVGLSQIRFPKGQISTVFEEIRRVLEREKIIEI